MERKLFLKNSTCLHLPKKVVDDKERFFFFASETLPKLTQDSTKQKCIYYLITKSEKKINRSTKNISLSLITAFSWSTPKMLILWLLSTEVDNFTSCFQLFRGSSVVELRTHDPKVVSLNLMWTLCCVFEQGAELWLAPLDPGHKWATA